MISKKKLGIVGGMGSPAGAVFLKKIIDYSPAEKDQEFLDIIFHSNSAIPDRTRAIIYDEPSPLEALYRSVDIFNQYGVDAVALACMTSYHYYDEISAYSNGLVINPLHLIADYINVEYPGFRRVGLLATTGSIKSGIFHKALRACNVELVTLCSQHQEEIFMRSVYMKNGLKSASASGESIDLMFESFSKISELNIDLVIGGCTEVSVGIHSRDVHMPYIDALDLLARRTVEYCYDLK